MPLDGKGAARQNTALHICVTLYIFRFIIFNNSFIVDFYGYMFVFHRKAFSVPLIVFHIHFLYILNGIQASSSAPVFMAVVHLNFITFFGPAAILVSGVKI